MAAAVVDNNALEVVPGRRNKRKISAPNPNVYMNPALDLLATEDTICNTTMEISPVKRGKRSKSCGDSSAFENPCLAAESNYNNVLASELWNVKHNLAIHHQTPNIVPNRSNETDYDIKLEHNLPVDPLQVSNVTCNLSACITSGEYSNNLNISLSFINRLDLNSPDRSSINSLYLDDDLNESNIMETKSINHNSNDVIASEYGHYLKSTNPFINCVSGEDSEMNTSDDAQISCGNQVLDFPFNIPVNDEKIPYLDSSNSNQTIIEEESEVDHFPVVPRRLFSDGNNSTVSSIDVSTQKEPEMAGCAESVELSSILKDPCYTKNKLNKQSKILGCDVSMFKQSDIMNINKKHSESAYISENDAQTDCTFSLRGNSLRASKRNKILLRPTLKVSNNLSKKVLKKLKHAFKHEKHDFSPATHSGNPYEVPRKTSKHVEKLADFGFENPALSLDCSDVEVEEISSDNESKDGSNFTNILNVNKYGTPPKAAMFKFKCNQSNPLREISNLELHLAEIHSDTLSKKSVRFNTTLNQEKIISGNSFDSFDSVMLDAASPKITCNDSRNLTMEKIDSELDDFHDELENCMNEKKFLQQNF